MAALQFLYLVCCVSGLVVSPVCGEDDWTWSPEFYKTDRNKKNYEQICLLYFNFEVKDLNITVFTLTHLLKARDK
jgi:hypothetical protein